MTKKSKVDGYDAVAAERDLLSLYFYDLARCWLVAVQFTSEAKTMKHSAYTHQSYPALFVLDSNGEAEGTVYHFCGVHCLEKFTETSEDSFSRGISADWIDGTECDRCGTVLVDTCACGSYDEGECGTCNAFESESDMERDLR